MKGGRGRRSTLYVIGDYLYYSGHLQGYILRVRCRYFKSRPIPCRGSAHLDTETLQIVKLSGEHSCVKDPDLKYKIQMETEMKELAETTDFTFKDIFNEVCLKNPEIAQRISFSRVSTSMRLRRDAARARRNWILIGMMLSSNNKTLNSNDVIGRKSDYNLKGTFKS